MKRKDNEMLVEKTSQLEIVAHKQATKREVKDVKKANDVLNNLFEDNHFTIKLYLASKT